MKQREKGHPVGPRQRSGNRPRWFVAIAVLAAIVVGVTAAVVAYGAGAPHSRNQAEVRHIATASASASPSAHASPAPSSAPGRSPRSKAAASGAPTDSSPLASRAVATPPPAVVSEAAAAVGKAVAEPSAPAIPFATSAAAARGITISITDLTAVAGAGQGLPGEVNGPSVLFHVVVANTSGKTASLASLVVNVAYGHAGTPAIQLSDKRAKAMPTSVSSGAVATGTYVFNVPESGRSHLTITVDYAPGVPVSVFEGAAPTT